MKKLSEEKYEIVWKFHGFSESRFPSWMIKSLKKSFMELYDNYVKWTRDTDLFNKLNNEFRALHYKVFPIKEMESLSGYMYGSWMTYQINERLYEKDDSYIDNLKDIGLEDWDLQPVIFMDGPTPDFGCALRHYPGYFISISLKPIE